MIILINQYIRYTYISFLLTGLFTILLLGCQKFSSSQKTSPKQVTITYNNGPHENDKEGVDLNRMQIADFNKSHRDIIVKWTDNQFNPEVFVAQMAGGTAEDCIFMSSTEGLNVVDKGYALDITDRFKTWEGFPDINSALLNPCTKNNRIYAIPVSAWVMGLWYNKKLFQDANIQPPKTWDELVKCAVTLTNRKKGVYGFGIFSKGGMGAVNFLDWTRQAGGDYERKVNGKWKAVFDEPSVVKAMEFIRDLRWKYNVLQPNLLAEPADLFPLFAQGKIAMMIGTNEWVPIVIDTYGMKREDIGTVPLPAGPAGHSNILGGGIVIINSTISKERQDAAWEWLKYFILSYDTSQWARDFQVLRQRHKVSGGSCFPFWMGERGEKMQAVEEQFGDVVVNWPEVWVEAAKYVNPHPPYYAHQLYETIEPVIQAVVTDSKTDIHKLLSEKNKEFQKRFIDPLSQGS